jgi:hypothetical protein
VLADSPVTGWQIDMVGPAQAASPAAVQYRVSFYGFPGAEGAPLLGPLTLTVTVDGRFQGRDEAYLDGATLSLIGSDGSCGPFQAGQDGVTSVCTLTGGHADDVRDVLLEGRLRLAYAVTIHVQLKTDNGLVLNTSRVTTLPGSPPPPDPGAVRCDDRGCYDVGTDIPSRRH